MLLPNVKGVLISLDYIIFILFVLQKSTSEFYFKYGKYGRKNIKFSFFIFTNNITNINFHTWIQNNKSFKKEIINVLIHKIKIQKITKNKKKILSSSKILLFVQVIVSFQLK